MHWLYESLFNLQSVFRISLFRDERWSGISLRYKTFNNILDYEFDSLSPEDYSDEMDVDVDVENEYYNSKGNPDFYSFLNQIQVFLPKR